MRQMMGLNDIEIRAKQGERNLTCEMDWRRIFKKDILQIATILRNRDSGKHRHAYNDL